VLILLSFFSLISSECMKSKSQSGEEDAVIKHLFEGTKGGTYVEIGGLDGYRYSNTLTLHTCHGWNGLLVEGSKNNYENLKLNVEKYRPDVKHIYGAVCTPPQSEVVFLDGPNGAVGGDTAHMSDTFKHTWHKKSSKKYSTPCKPMSDYLKGMDVINFFSLDVEGAEFEVVSTIDFHAVHIDVMIVELDQHNPSRNYKVRRAMFNANFVECLDVVSRSALFLNRNPTNADKYKCPGVISTNATTEEAKPMLLGLV
jgi:hypothetical protein